MKKPSKEVRLRFTEGMKRKPCRDLNGNIGLCMFKYECIRQSGVSSSTCSDGFLIGVCCLLTSSDTSSLRNQNSTETQIITNISNNKNDSSFFNLLPKNSDAKLKASIEPNYLVSNDSTTTESSFIKYYNDLIYSNRENDRNRNIFSSAKHISGEIYNEMEIVNISTENNKMQYTSQSTDISELPIENEDMYEELSASLNNYAVFQDYLNITNYTSGYPLLDKHFLSIYTSIEKTEPKQHSLNLAPSTLISNNVTSSSFPTDIHEKNIIQEFTSENRTSSAQTLFHYISKVDSLETAPFTLPSLESNKSAEDNYNIDSIIKLETNSLEYMHFEEELYTKKPNMYTDSKSSLTLPPPFNIEAFIKSKHSIEPLHIDKNSISSTNYTIFLPPKKLTFEDSYNKSIEKDLIMLEPSSNISVSDQHVYSYKIVDYENSSDLSSSTYQVDSKNDEVVTQHPSEFSKLIVHPTEAIQITPKDDIQANSPQENKYGLISESDLIQLPEEGMGDNSMKYNLSNLFNTTQINVPNTTTILYENTINVSSLFNESDFKVDYNYTTISGILLKPTYNFNSINSEDESQDTNNEIMGPQHYSGSTITKTKTTESSIRQEVFKKTVATTSSPFIPVTLDMSDDWMTSASKIESFQLESTETVIGQDYTLSTTTVEEKTIDTFPTSSEEHLTESDSSWSDTDVKETLPYVLKSTVLFSPSSLENVSNIASELFLKQDDVTTEPSRSWNYKTDCGVRFMKSKGRIVGGDNAYFGKWPWQALVKEATWLGLFVKNKCGGVLINPRYVLTAAHCQPGFLASLLVILGAYDLDNSLDNKSYLIRNVKRMVVHRHYNALTFENDLALLEMERVVEFLPYITPLCLPYRDEDFTGKLAFVTGWGKLTHGGAVPKILQEVQVPIVENENCQKMFFHAGHKKAITKNFICAGYTNGGQDSCEGDSGGPLMIEREDHRWVLVGTVSHGIGCAHPNLPGVYMRMSAYRPWIDNIINRST